MLDSWVRMWKKAFVVYIRVLFQQKGQREVAACTVP